MKTAEGNLTPVQHRDLIPLSIARMMLTCFVNTGQLGQAERLLQDVRLAEDADNLHYDLGLAYVNQGQLDTALDHFRTVRERYPDHALNAQAALATLRAQAGQRAGQQDWPGAQQALAEALEINPHDPQLHQYLGAVKEGLPVFYLAQNKLAEAAEIWEQAQQAVPTNYRVAHQLAILYHRWAIELEQAGDTRAAHRLWPKALANWVLLIQADSFWVEWPQKRAGVYGMPIEDTAISHLREKGLRERLEEVQRDFVTAYTQANDTPNAERHKQYRSLLDLELKTAKALKETSSLLAQQGHKASVPVAAGPVLLNQLGLLAAAKTMAEQGQKVAPKAEAPKNLAAYLSSLGRLHLLVEKQQTDLAVDELKRIIQQEPDNAEARRLLVRALKEAGEEWIKAGEVEKAIAAWAEGLTHDQGSDELKELISRACLKKAIELDRAGSMDGAINLLKLGLSYAPDRRDLREKLADCFNRRGVAYAKRNEWEPAVADLQQALTYNPAHPQARENLAQVQQIQQRGSLELQQARQRGQIQEINRLLEAGQAEAAIPLLRQALQANPTNDELKGLMALACNLHGVNLTNKAAAAQNPTEKDRLLNETETILALGLQYRPEDTTLKNNLAAVHKIKAILKGRR